MGFVKSQNLNKMQPNGPPTVIVFYTTPLQKRKTSALLSICEQMADWQKFPFAGSLNKMLWEMGGSFNRDLLSPFIADDYDMDLAQNEKCDTN